jgi:acyl dehydratase
MRIPKGHTYEEVSVGDSFQTSLTVTETHLVMGAGLFGDFNPLHVDETFAAASRFGGRILHGPLTSALISASVGMFFVGTAIAYLEHNCRFSAPVRPGDTLTTVWTVSGKTDKPKVGGGIVELTAKCTNQAEIVVADADGKVLVGEG